MSPSPPPPERREKALLCQDNRRDSDFVLRLLKVYLSFHGPDEPRSLSFET